MFRLMLAALCAALIIPAAYADIAPDPAAKGQSLAPKDKTAVAMDAEKVEVTLSENSAHVRATFWMRNTAESSTTLEVGFPDQVRPFEEEEGLSLTNLKVTVDGAEQKTEPYDPTRKGPGTYSFTPGQDRTAWFLWTTTFGPEQKRTIVVEYDCRTFEARESEVPTWSKADELELDMYEGRVPESKEFGKNKPAEDDWGEIKVYGARQSALQRKRNREFAYVLATGAGWSGPIGKGLIRVRLADEAAHCIEALNPHGASWQGDTITWTFEDLEPTAEHNIVIRYRQGTHHAIGLKPGIDNLLAALRQRNHKNWLAAVELAKHIGTVECLNALGLETTTASR
ncbi:MAG: DUF4424 family protein [Verrucomicrobia bacterium]|nr:DUF4424 family protein [Verrucomicrobiota bacterium]